MNGHDSIILAAGSNVVTSALDLFSQFAIIGGFSDNPNYYFSFFT